MHITLSLVLPREERSVPVVRHICARVLEEICARPEVISDIEIALTEACANVVEHSGPGDDYSVEVTIHEATCVIRVVDCGVGLDAVPDADQPLDLSAEGGRGVLLMRALVDRVRFESKPQEGTIVRLEKRLVFNGASPLAGAAATADRPAVH